jgi:hypothetical protein
MGPGHPDADISLTFLLYSGRMNLPGVIVQFLDRASVAIGCTRDRDLVPRIHYVSGWQLDADQRSIWCFIPEAFTPGLQSSLEDNGHFALTVEHIGPHECYQFKGRYRSMRPSTEYDRAVVARCRERFASAVTALLSNYASQSQALRRYILDPAVAVRFDVREVYLQTPGPGAGSLLAKLGDRP